MRKLQTYLREFQIHMQFKREEKLELLLSRIKPMINYRKNLLKILLIKFKKKWNIPAR